MTTPTPPTDPLARLLELVAHRGAGYALGAMPIEDLPPILDELTAAREVIRHARDMGGGTAHLDALSAALARYDAAITKGAST